MDQPKQFITTPIAVLVGAIVISIAILIHGGVIKVGGLSKTQQPAPQVGQPVAEEPTGPVKVSVDDDPLLGNKDAPITLIEFSDYECPFCKRHFDQTLPQIKKDYIDTGKVKLIFRDFPLSFHDPMATYEAQAANCAREQGGDTAYFKIHDEMFKKTTSNGNGLTKDQIKQLATDLGLNGTNILSCADSDKYKDEVTKDITDGSAVGVSGTPAFFIGKSNSTGVIEGTIVVGAQPYSVFQSAFDKLQ
ncbi:hypothetical protein A3C59_01475 [Candidatus Daviesbacteria bacterium RIFCSPHIGHO2_02_FULL_36_13]|uniref:Thioredoxin domain-containing protein n=1 Tax=Candidatus Daviesbacteria bacterium RIFCSPHIGHO2_02_FULL_36_13 TaxID=1797768 RepID=A0A1F5JV61_9BACT|nr:MAG: hypothetical protein A3C59_01475 [Candidatus Daviesbacteria bacterium RIFCSPHIGHO2_02_FULL_36_13]